MQNVGFERNSEGWVQRLFVLHPREDLKGSESVVGEDFSRGKYGWKTLCYAHPLHPSLKPGRGALGGPLGSLR